MPHPLFAHSTPACPRSAAAAISVCRVTVPPVVSVVGGALVRHGRVLASRRTDPPALAGLWEFPGGKVEAGETDEGALVRELQEELGLTVVVGPRVGPELAIGTTAVLRVYVCEAPPDGEPALVDHDAHRWLSADELDDVAWIPVDAPVVAALREMITIEGRW